jgi:hypothetical protein
MAEDAFVVVTDGKGFCWTSADAWRNPSDVIAAKLVPAKELVKQFARIGLSAWD